MDGSAPQGSGRAQALSSSLVILNTWVTPGWPLPPEAFFKFWWYVPPPGSNPICSFSPSSSLHALFLAPASFSPFCSLPSPSALFASALKLRCPRAASSAQATPSQRTLLLCTQLWDLQSSHLLLPSLFLQRILFLPREYEVQCQRPFVPPHTSRSALLLSLRQAQRLFAPLPPSCLIRLRILALWSKLCGLLLKAKPPVLLFTSHD